MTGKPLHSWNQASRITLFGWNRTQWLTALSLYAQAHQVAPSQAYSTIQSFLDVQTWWLETYPSDPLREVMSIVPDYTSRTDGKTENLKEIIRTLFFTERHHVEETSSLELQCSK